MARYGLNILWSDEDEAFVATCPDFPGLSAFGDTPEEALKEGTLCLQLFQESLMASGDPLPEPTYVQEFSGQTRIRLPKSLHQALAQKAELEGVSLNTWVVSLLSERNATSRLADEVCSRISKVEHAIKVHAAESNEQFRIQKAITYNPESTEGGSYGEIKPKISEWTPAYSGYVQSYRRYQPSKRNSH